MGDRIGIDLGGTKIEGVILRPDGEIHQRVRLATPRNDYRGTVAAIVDLAERLDPEKKLKIGVGTPGSWVPARSLMQNCNSTWLNRQPLLHDLNDLLGGRVRIANDADCFALSEANGGSADGSANVFGVILGTGVGGGVVVNKQLVQGPNGLSGEWGHTPIGKLPETEPPLPARDCYCGRQNCVETYLSGPGLLTTHQTLWPDDAAASAEEVYLQAQPALGSARWWSSDAPSSSDEGATRARRTIFIWCRMLAENLAAIVNTLDPHAIVLGGGLSQMTEVYAAVRELMSPHVFGEVFETQLLTPKFGATSGVRGAAWLWAPEES